MTFEHYILSCMAAAQVAQWAFFKQKADRCELDRKLFWRVAYKMLSGYRLFEKCSATGCPMRDVAGEILKDVNEDLDADEAKDRVLHAMNISHRGRLKLPVENSVFGQPIKA